MTMKRTIWALALAGLPLLGCGHHFETTTPAGFVELEDQEAYEYRATTADGLVIAVREIDHEPKGETAFWVRAIENRMRQRGGYALLGTRDVKSKSGLDGKQLKFGHDESGKPHLYTVTLFVTESHIFLLEAGGTKELMESGSAGLDQFVEGFRVK
jgi:hypothetical protein